MPLIKERFPEVIAADDKRFNHQIARELEELERQNKRPKTATNVDG